QRRVRPRRIGGDLPRRPGRQRDRDLPRSSARRVAEDARRRAGDGDAATRPRRAAARARALAAADGRRRAATAGGTEPAAGAARGGRPLHRRAAGWLALLALLTALIWPAGAAAAPSEQVGCQFVLGFAAIREQIGAERVGACAENEHYNPERGDALQKT